VASTAQRVLAFVALAQPRTMAVPYARQLHRTCTSARVQERRDTTKHAHSRAPSRIGHGPTPASERRKVTKGRVSETERGCVCGLSQPNDAKHWSLESLQRVSLSGASRDSSSATLLSCVRRLFWAARWGTSSLVTLDSVCLDDASRTSTCLMRTSNLN
jgi:hypothetical protein